MDCLVTGGAGFIGSHLVDALVARGDRVTVLDDLSSGRHENLAPALSHGAILHVVDIRDDVAVAALAETAQPEIVFHLAAQVDVRRSVRQPRDDAMTNILGTIAVLQTAVAAGARRVIFSSSGGAVYGDADVVPTPESHPARPISPYGQGKYAAEGYCDLYGRSTGLSTASLRFSNVYGPRQDAHGEGGVAAIFAGCLVEGRSPTVYGDGNQTRDWVEVSDVVRANLLAAESELSGPINIGTGEENSVLDLLRALRELDAGGDLREPQFAPARPGEVRRSVIDAGRARRELGWTPQVDLHQGLAVLLASLQMSCGGRPL